MHSDSPPVDRQNVLGWSLHCGHNLNRNSWPVSGSQLFSREGLLVCCVAVFGVGAYTLDQREATGAMVWLPAG